MRAGKVGAGDTAVVVDGYAAESPRWQAIPGRLSFYRDIYQARWALGCAGRARGRSEPLEFRRRVLMRPMSSLLCRGHGAVRFPEAAGHDRPDRVTKRPLSPGANWLALQLREPAMEHVHCTTTIREPWNKGKLVGQKAPFKLKEIWAIRIRLQLATVGATWRCSTWPSTANFELATWSNSASETSATGAESHPGRSCSSRKPKVRCSSRSRSRPGTRSVPGSGTPG